jgi:hypothetical protein
LATGGSLVTAPLESSSKKVELENLSDGEIRRMSTMPDNLLVAVVNKVNANDIKGKKIETLTYEINSHLERD